MRTLKEYVEEKECEKIFSEGFVTDTIGHMLGFAGTGVAYAWMASLILKGGVKAVESIKRTLKGEEKKKFEDAYEEVKKSPAVKEQSIKQKEIKNKYEDELENVLIAINKNEAESAAEEFKKLDPQLQNSVEAKRIIIDACSKNFGYVISGTPTPGTPTFKAIRTIMGLPVAKAAAKAFEDSIQKMIGEN